MDKRLADALEEKRAAFEPHLRAVFDDIAPRELHEAARWYPDAGGKRLRPSMALLACQSVGGAWEDALPVALAVELVHNFSLVHDDMMDRDDTRRGQPTVHIKWNEATAILAGDVLFAKAFEVLANIPDAQSHKEAAIDLARVVRKLCEGQALDVEFERREQVSLDEYKAMIRGKTALLFEAATRGGALCALPRARPDLVEALARFGENFGLAFQIADDLLDVTGDSATLGKPWGSDIRAGKQTLIVVEAMARADERQREVLDDVLGRLDASESDVRRVVEVFQATGALAAAQAAAADLGTEAERALDALPESPARETLRALNRWALERQT